MKIFLLISLLVVTSNATAQLKTHTFQEAEVLSGKSPKPFVIFTHTTWCKFCRMMENTTFKNDQIITLLNNSFYFITLDAEHKEPIVFNKHTYKFAPTGIQSGIHELAAELSEHGETGYPLLTILDADYAILFQKTGYVKSEDLLLILNQINKAD